MITEVVDIQGKKLHVGDHVAWGDTTSSYNAIICHGEIVDMWKTPNQTHIKVKVIKEGGWWAYEGYIRTFIYPRNYHNLIKL